MQVAVAGVGAFARAFALPGLQLAKGVETKGVYDVDAAVARATAETFGCSAYPDLSALLDARPDLVYVATPPGAHAGLVDAAIGAGCNVLCEKPMCLTAREVEIALHRADAAGLLHAVDHEWRFTSAYKTMRAMVREGRLGEVRKVSVSIDANYALVPDYPTYYAGYATLRADGGGIILQVLSHYLDLFGYIFGGVEPAGGALATLLPYKPRSPDDPTRIFIDAEDSCALSGFLPNGAPVSISATWVAQAPSGAQWTVSGSRDSVLYRTIGLMNGGKLARVNSDFALEPIEQLPEYEPSVSGDGNPPTYTHGLFAAQLEGIAAAIDGGRRSGTFATFADELAVRRNIEAWRSTGIRAGTG